MAKGIDDLMNNFYAKEKAFVAFPPICITKIDPETTTVAPS